VQARVPSLKRRDATNAEKKISILKAQPLKNVAQLTGPSYKFYLDTRSHRD